MVVRQAPDQAHEARATSSSACPRRSATLLRSAGRPAARAPHRGSRRPASAACTRPAYADDREADAEYQRLVRDDLVASPPRRSRGGRGHGRRRASSTRSSSVAWMGAVNDLRLVLGTKLDVERGPAFDIGDDDPTGLPTSRSTPTSGGCSSRWSRRSTPAVVIADPPLPTGSRAALEGHRRARRSAVAGSTPNWQHGGPFARSAHESGCYCSQALNGSGPHRLAA